MSGTSVQAGLLVLLLMSSGVPLLCGLPAAEGGPLDGSPPWFDGNLRFRVKVVVEALPFPMVNHPVEVDLDLSGHLDPSDGGLDAGSLLVVEYSGEGGGSSPVRKREAADRIGSHAVPSRFYEAYGADPLDPHGTITWIADGRTTGKRYYHIYFNTDADRDVDIPDLGDAYALLDSQYWVQRGNVFYGFNPGEEVKWPDIDAVEVVGLYDGTTAEVHDITDGATALLATVKLDEGDLERIQVPDGTYFKVTADRPIVASVSSAMQEGGSAKTVYPSRDGGLVGRDFIIAPYSNTEWNGRTYGLQVFGVEESTVTITNEEGAVVRTLTLVDRAHLEVLGLEVNGTYHIEATGDIMLEQEAINAFTSIPSVTGAPVGRSFLGSVQDFDSSGFLVLPYEDAYLTVTDVDTGDVVHKGGLVKGQHIFEGGVGDRTMRFESTGNISLVIGSTEGGAEIGFLGDDVSFTGGIGGRRHITYSIRNPGPGAKDEAYAGAPYPGAVFAFRDGTHVTVDDTEMVLEADGYIGLGQGLHVITSDMPVSVMTLGRGYDDPADHRWNDWGTYLAGGLTPPDVQVSDVEEVVEGFDLRPAASEGAVNDTMVHAVEPGSSTTFDLEVENIGHLDVMVHLEALEAPAGWSTYLDRDAITIAKGDMAEVSLRVTVPSDERGDTRATILVNGSSDGTRGMTDSVLAVVVVDPFHFPELTGETTEHVLPGGTAEFSLDITNRGNVADDLSLGLEGPSGQGWSRDLDVTAVHLDVNESHPLMLRVTAPDPALAGTSLTVDIVARSSGDPTRVTYLRTLTIVLQFYLYAANVTELVEIVPGGTADVELAIENGGNGRDDFRVATDIGDGRFSVDVPATTSVAAYGDVVQPITVKAPGWDDGMGAWGVTPGDLVMAVRVTDSAGLAWTGNVTVRVLQVFDVTITAEWDVVKAQSTQEAVFRLWVSNHGNGDDTVSLSADGPEARLSVAEVYLETGGSANVDCTVPPPEGRPPTTVIQVLAISSGGNVSSISLTVEWRYPVTDLVVGDLSCLWVVLAALGVLAAAETARRLSIKRRTSAAAIPGGEASRSRRPPHGRGRPRNRSRSRPRPPAP